MQHHRRPSTLALLLGGALGTAVLVSTPLGSTVLAQQSEIDKAVKQTQQLEKDRDRQREREQVRDERRERQARDQQRDEEQQQARKREKEQERAREERQSVEAQQARLREQQRDRERDEARERAQREERGQRRQQEQVIAQRRDREEIADRAEAACRREARQRDFDVVDMSRANVAGGGRAELEMRLSRRGDDFRAECRYDDDNRAARLDVNESGSSRRDNRGGVLNLGEQVEEARQLCRREADRRDLNISSMSDARQMDTGDIRIIMDVRRNDRRIEATCMYDPRRRAVDLDVEDGRGDDRRRDGRRSDLDDGRRNFDGRGDYASTDQVRDKCVEAGLERRYRLVDAGRVETRGSSVSELPVTFEVEGLPTRMRCRFDNRDRSVTLLR